MVRQDQALIAKWAALDAPRPILDGRFSSRPGVFAWDRIDPASALLAEHLPADLAGKGADLGAGYGYLSAEILSRCAKVSALDLYEAEARALDAGEAESRAVRAASHARLSLARCHHRRAGAVRLHRQQSAFPHPEPRGPSRCRPPFHRGGRRVAQARRTAVPGRQPAPAVRSGAQRQLRPGARGRASATASR